MIDVILICWFFLARSGNQKFFSERQDYDVFTRPPLVPAEKFVILARPIAKYIDRDSFATTQFLHSENTCTDVIGCQHKATEKFTHHSQF